MQRLDEPLDMSIKSRKRSPLYEYLPKKKRASVVARGSSAEAGQSNHPVGNLITVPKIEVKVEVDSPPSTPPSSNSMKKGNGQKSHILNDLLTGGGYERPERATLTAEDVKHAQTHHPTTQRIFISNEVEGGLEEHFRRSLCREFYDDVETAGVDAHFSRSLGSAKWEEIQRGNDQLYKSLDLSVSGGGPKVKK